jgi:type II secretory pathway pseudopilin PulG
MTAAAMVDSLFIKRSDRLATGSVHQGLRLIVFVLVSILLGSVIQRLAQQRAQIRIAELQKRSAIADAERQLAEERARLSKELRDREGCCNSHCKRYGDMGLGPAAGTVHWSEEVYSGWWAANQRPLNQALKLSLKSSTTRR